MKIEITSSADLYQENWPHIDELQILKHKESNISSAK